MRCEYGHSSRIVSLDSFLLCYKQTSTKNQSFHVVLKNCLLGKRPGYCLFSLEIGFSKIAHWGTIFQGFQINNFQNNFRISMSSFFGKIVVLWTISCSKPNRKTMNKGSLALPYCLNC